MRKNFLVLLLMCSSTIFLAQNSGVDKKRTQWDSINGCGVVWDSNHIVSKEIKGDLYSYKAVLARNQNSYVKAELKLDSVFKPIQSFLNNEIRQSLQLDLPYYQVRIDGYYGYSSGYNLHYKGERITIFRDCGCGTFKGQRVSGRRIRVMGNFFFTRPARLYLHFRNPRVNEFDFQFKFENGLPKSFVSFQYTNLLDKKIKFKNGKLDSLKSYYPNGELEFEASVIEGKLTGYFVFYHSNGDEKFKVFFRNNKVLHFINEEGRYDWNEGLNNWTLYY